MKKFQLNRKTILKAVGLLAFILFLGPEALVLGITAELVSVIEISSLSILFVAYLSSFKPFLNTALANFEHFERYSWFTVPTKSMVIERPSILCLLIPLRSIIYIADSNPKCIMV